MKKSNDFLFIKAEEWNYMKKIWMLAGESSGDMYGAALAKELQQIAAANGETVEISGMGSAKMREAGVNIIVDST